MYLTEPNVLNGVLLELGTYVSIKICCLTLCAYNVLMFPVIVSLLQVHMSSLLATHYVYQYLAILSSFVLNLFRLLYGYTD